MFKFLKKLLRPHAESIQERLKQEEKFQKLCGQLKTVWEKTEEPTEIVGVAYDERSLVIHHANGLKKTFNFQIKSGVAVITVDTKGNNYINGTLTNPLSFNSFECRVRQTVHSLWPRHELN